MKKLIALLLALVMVFSVAAVFAGCEDDSKKNSKVEKDEDEDEDEDEKDDETTAPEGDETTAPEADDPTDPEPTDPEPTDPEPTDPEPTEDDVTGELMDAPDVIFDENIKVLGMTIELVDGSDTVSAELGMQELSEDECYIYYCDEDVNAIVYIKGEEMVRYAYDEATELFVEDTEATAEDIANEVMGATYLMSMFVATPELFAGAQYEKLGVEEIEGYGEVAAYNVYANGELIYTIYVQVETGLTLNIADAEGNDIAYVTFVTQDIDFASMIG